MVRRAVNIPEIEIIHPLINIKGLGIPDGTVNDMLIEVEKAYNNGKGIYGMKPLGGGNLIKSYDSAIDFVLGIPHLSSIALGMKTKEEVIANVMKFKGINIPQSLKSTLAKQTKNVIVEDWCIGCGRCAVKCPQKAIKIIDGKAYINKELCILCGYCSGYCPEFCIKIV
ncbi:MAG TPA: 4Fe-4S binding protein [Thermoanaerobacterales bacterium]|nr:4Fe-4S binding protein [Thermoanaerobacterales bacterium]